MPPPAVPNIIDGRPTILIVLIMLRIIANAIFLLGLAPWAIMFMFSAMLFDAPGSENSWIARGLFYSIASYPVLVAIGFFSSGGLWALKEGHQWRNYLVLLPLVSFVLVILFMILSDRICGGRLSC